MHYTFYVDILYMYTTEKSSRFGKVYKLNQYKGLNVSFIMPPFEEEGANRLSYIGRSVIQVISDHYL